MRLTHTSALRGFAVLTAGAALFASAMLAGAGAANAAPVSAPAQATAQTIGQTPTYGGESHCWWHKDGKKGHEKDGKKEHHGKKDHHGKGDSEKSWGAMSDDGYGMTDHEKDGKKDGKKEHEKDGKKEHDGKKDHAADLMEKDGDHSKADSEKHWGAMKDQGWQKDGKKDGKKDHHGKKGHHKHGKKDHCAMPSGSVESGFGGAALADSQSPATSISLGALSALMLGGGVWTLARTRRTRTAVK